jgi:dipeptidyl aminopeptidase/acylaminoacyl peptidase
MAHAGDASHPRMDDDENRVLRKLAAISLCLLAVPASAGAGISDVGRIAYTSDRDGNNEIYTARIDGFGETNLTNNPATDQAPAWSRDGSRIAFESDRGGRFDIWVMNADGSNPQQVTSGTPDSSDSEPVWSPDGTQIVFSSSRGDGSWHLWVVDLGSGTLRRLTSGWGTAPAWSPDGTHIAYDGGAGELRIVDADGSNDQQLTGCACTGPAGSPAWSPDGSFLIFGRYDDDWQTTNARQLYFVGANGGEGIPITSGPYYHGHPAVSPDGSMVVFQRQDGVLGSPELYVMALSDLVPYPAVTGPGRNFTPSWGPTFVAPPPPPPADTTPPTITIRRPTSGTDRIDVYTVGQVVLADYECSDDGSGVRHCEGPARSGDPIDTRSVGTFDFTVFAADQAGNPVYRTTQYRVIYPFDGFASPIVNDALNDVKAGNGAPLKFSLGADYGLDILTDASATPIDCASREAAGASMGAAGPFSYNASQGRYMKVWTTDKSAAGSCWRVTLTLRDGTRHGVDFRLTK